MHIAGTIGHVLARSGRVGEGPALLLQTAKARKTLGAIGSSIRYSLFLVNLGEAYLLAGRPEDHRIGDRAKGDEYLATAITMYREMEMSFWLTQAEAGLRPLSLTRSDGPGLDVR